MMKRPRGFMYRRTAAVQDNSNRNVETGEPLVQQLLAVVDLPGEQLHSDNHQQTFRGNAALHHEKRGRPRDQLTRPEGLAGEKVAVVKKGASDPERKLTVMSFTPNNFHTH
ncbi:uncharacterized protein AB9X84_004715 isoform 1-T8 [Acanthopagrus schlegelii]